MSIIKLLGQLTLIYLLYKVVFNFIIPTYKGIKLVKTKMNDMANRVHEPEQTKPNPTAPPKAAKPNSSDYIDYEEIK